MNIPFFANLAYTVLAYLLTYMAGSAVLALSGDTEKSMRNEFRKHAFGVWLLIAVWSVWHTGGYTLSLGLVLVAGFALYEYRPKCQPAFVFNGTGLLLHLGLLLLFFSLLYVQVYDPVSGALRYYTIDLPAQATLVEKLNWTGLESTHTDFYFQIPLRNLYHYGDLWFPALFSRLLDVRAMPSVYFIYGTIGATAVTGGALALAEQLRDGRKMTRTDILLALGFIGLSGISFYVPKTGWLDARWGEYFTMIGQPKLYWVVMSVLYSVLSLHRKDLYGCTLAILTAVVLYMVAAPALLTGWLALVLYHQVTGRIGWAEVAKLMFPVLGLLAFLLVYMLLNREITTTSATGLPGSVVSRILSGDSRFLKDVVYTFLYTSVRLLIAGWPFLLILALGRKPVRQQAQLIPVLLFLLAGMVGAVGAYSLFFHNVDGFQFWTVPYAGLSAIFVLCLLLSTPLPAWFKLTVLGLCWYQNTYVYTDKQHTYRTYAYDKPFVQKILEETGTDGGSAIAVLRKPVRQAYDPLWSSDPNQYFPYDLLKWTLNDYHPYNLSLLDTELQDDPAWADFQRAYIRHSTFSIFVSRSRRAGTFVSAEQSQLDFIREARIRFLLIEPGARPNTRLDPVIAKTFTDPRTGYRFCVLRIN